MSLKSTVDINVDFYDKKYMLINAKQLDKSSRFLSVTCYSQGEIMPINADEYSAYIRYKKPDNYSVFNFCEINSRGKVIVELTEQMLASDGICYADLVITNKGDANVDEETGEIISIEDASILSTMTFCIDVHEMAINNSDVESSYEFDGLNVMLERAEAEYANVIRMARSYAVGDAGGIREDEDIDNAKYYYEQCRDNVAGSSVLGVKGNNESTYRKGNVNLTANNIGAISISDIATVNEVKNYLNI